MAHDSLLPPTADDIARIEHRARMARDRAPGSLAARLADDVLRLLRERVRLLVPGEGRGDGH